MLDIQVIAYLCFSAIPLLACMCSTIYYLFSSLFMISPSSTGGSVELKRPFLNRIFTAPLMYLRDAIDAFFIFITKLIKDKRNEHIDASRDAYDKPTEDKEERKARSLEKYSILLDYFYFFASEMILLLILFFAMYLLTPDLTVVFRSTFDSVQGHITSLNTSNVIEVLIHIVRNVVGGFKEMISMVNLLDWRWCIFIILLFFTAAPIRVWHIEEKGLTPKKLGSLLKNIFVHYGSTFFSTFFSVQAVFGIISILISILSYIISFDSAAVSAYIVHMSLYFAGMYMIAIIGQAVIYTCDLAIGIVTLPLRFIFRSKEEY